MAVTRGGHIPGLGEGGLVRNLFCDVIAHVIITVSVRLGGATKQHSSGVLLAITSKGCNTNA